MKRRWLVAAALLLTTMCSTSVATAAPPAITGTPISGPDVSRWNHPNGACINWATVAAGNATTPPRQFAFIKATEGSTYKNPYFFSCAGRTRSGDWAATATAGVARAAYHFAKPNLPISDAVAEARYFVSAIGNQQLPGTLAPVLDLEDNSSGLTPAQLILWTQTWLDTVRRLTGRIPIIYTYPNFWATSMAGSQAFHAYPIWMADYRAQCASPSDIACFAASGPQLPVQGNWPQWTFWQFTSSAPQPGITGRVDMSVFSGDATALAALADGTQPIVWAPTAPAPPVRVAATPGNGRATVTWLPADNGGALVTAYVVTSSVGRSITVPATATSLSFPSLVNGSPYSFTVTAVNPIGRGLASAGSKVVVPMVPTQFTSSLTSATISYGDSTAMNGTLVRTDTGAPLAGQTVAVWQRPKGMGAWLQVASLVSDASGTVTWPFTPLVSTDTKLVWTPVDPGLTPQTSSIRTVTVQNIATVIDSQPAVSVRPGAATTVSATLRRVDNGAPVAGVVVDVSTRTAGAVDWVPLASLTTDVDGRVTTQPMTPAVSTDVRFSYAAPAHWTSAEAEVAVSVAPAISAVMSPSAVRLTRAVHLYGTASTVLAGRHVFLQQLVAGRWTTVATQDLTGTAAYNFGFTPRSRGTFSYRVVVPGNASYLAAISSTRAVVVR
ncbi:MAG: lysozyme [Frankiaceae bacterium]|nr:lysozyme [Frankiaceae bacterium]